ncbi:MAG: hypothetical protein HQK68_11090, partial [Desulfamplus sp.]|nr:hypothetical protein [Desulfamplus sp.]
VAPTVSATIAPAAKAVTLGKVAATAAVPATKVAAATVPTATAATMTGAASTFKSILLSPMFGMLALGGLVAFGLWKMNKDADKS